MTRRYVYAAIGSLLVFSLSVWLGGRSSPNDTFLVLGTAVGVVYAAAVFPIQLWVSAHPDELRDTIAEIPLRQRLVAIVVVGTAAVGVRSASMVLWTGDALWRDGLAVALFAGGALVPPYCAWWLYRRVIDRRQRLAGV